MVLRKKLNMGDLTIYYLLQIIQGKGGSLWMQYRCLKRQIKVYINDKVYFGICERN